MEADPGDWNQAFARKGWGRWPSEHVVRQMAAIGGGPLDVLEIGCGPGAQLRYLSEEGHDAVGIDVSDVALSRAAQRLGRVGYQSRLALADGRRLPFCDASFDVVLDVEVFVYSTPADQARVWIEAARVLRPGGQVISLAFTRRTHLPAIAEQWTLNPVEPAEWVRLAAVAGLVARDQQTVTRTTGPGHDLIEETVLRAAKGD